MILGLTGGIGSGKSLVTEILQTEYGFHVIRTDAVAAEMMVSDENLKEQLKKAFGNEIYDPDGTLNRKKYAELIYGVPGMRELSDSIVHPAVWQETKRQIGEIRNAAGQDADIAVETALPGDSLGKICDTVWHISADAEIRTMRLMETRNYSREYAEAVMKRQLPEERYGKIADRVIMNNGSVEELREEIRGLL